MAAAAPKSDRLAELALSAFSLLLFAAVAEATIRGLGLGEARHTGYAPVNTSLRANRRENSRGYRDAERALEKPAGTRRVVCLGDSFTWGHGVEMEDAYPQRLERTLSLRRGEPWQAINLGKEGADTVDEGVILAREGLAYQPDIVLLGYVLNDSEDEAARKQRQAVWEERRYPPALLWNHCALYRWVGGRLWASRDNRAREREYHELFADTAPGWQASRQALVAIAARCAEAKIPLVVAIFPLFANPLDDRYPFKEIHAKVTRAVTEAGAKPVDLLPAYQSLHWELLVVDGAWDEHPNEIAHRIAARAIADEIDKLVPRSQG